MGVTEDSSGVSRVQVVVRVRPLMPHDSGDSSAVTCNDERTQVQVMMPGREFEKAGAPGSRPQGAVARAYTFDACLDGAVSQEEVYNQCGITGLVDAALQGYSVTVFAFGQTGSGKTHSLAGPSGKGLKVSTAAVGPHDGMIARAVQYLYDASATDSTATHLIRGTFCEIYNEQVRDLTVDSPMPLPVRHDQRTGFYVDGLTSLPVPDVSDAQAAVSRALTHRIVGAHRLNRSSNRSHCMLTFHLESTPSTTAGGARPGTAAGMRRFGKLCFVDLAGSERLKETGGGGTASMRETGNINRSLFALGKVIAKLARPGSSGGHRGGGTGGGGAFVPYRDSKLTQLLIDSLRGTGRALMLACLSPDSSHAEETLNTLHFASMALRVRSKPVLVLDPQDQLVVDLKHTIKQLRMENQRLIDALERNLGPGALDSPVTSPVKMQQAQERKAAPASPLTHSSATASPIIINNKYAGVSSSSNPRGPNRPPPVVVEPSSSPTTTAGQRRRTSGRAAATSSSPSDSVAPSSPPTASRPSSTAASPVGYRKPAVPVIRKPSARLATSKATTDASGGEYGAAGTGKENLTTAYSSLPAAASASPRRDARNSGRRRAPPPPAVELDALSAFPELAALEAQFQAQLASVKGGGTDGGGGGGAGLSVAGGPAAEEATSPSVERGGGAASPSTSSFQSLSQMQAQFQQRLSSARVSPKVKPQRKPSAPQSPQSPGTARAKAAARAEAEAQAAVQPEAKAAAWAVRNKWFGTDTEMTEAAYDVHDVLMAEGVDPASQLYYDEIEKRVAAQYPVKMAQYQQHTTTTGATKRSNDSARRGRANASNARGVGGGAAVGSAAPHQQRGRQSARMRRPTEPVAPSVRAILKSISSTTYTPTGWSAGAFGGAAGSSLGSTAEAPLSVAGSGMAFSAREASPMHSSRSPTKARGSNSRGSRAGSRAGSAGSTRPAWQGRCSDDVGYGSRGSTPGGSGESMAPFLVNTQDFLARRQAVVAELRAAKEEAQAEHRRLQAKIRQRLGLMAY